MVEQVRLRPLRPGHRLRHAVNDSVRDDYSIINSDPFGAGWLFESRSRVGPLMTAAEYAEATGV